MEKELEIVEIDNKEYYVIKEIPHGNNVYLYLSNVTNDDDMMIRKTTSQDKDLIVPLSSKQEFDIACALMFSNQKRAS